MSLSSIFLLKTPSTPHDSYLTTLTSQFPSAAISFLPVLSHSFSSSALDQLSAALDSGLEEYGGLIFTSQRAVEGFLSLHSRAKPVSAPPKELPVYVVGPATFTALTISPESPFRSTPENILGQETGNGDALADFIIKDYIPRFQPLAETADGSRMTQAKKLLFLVGEKRRDIIPKKLAAIGVTVDELEVYATIENPEFPALVEDALLHVLPRNADAPVWIVVFSPQGCKSMLQAVGKVQESGTVQNSVRIATIGPTTAETMRSLNREPDFIAGKPTAEAIRDGIIDFGKA